MHTNADIHTETNTNRNIHDDAKCIQTIFIIVGLSK